MPEYLRLEVFFMKLQINCIRDVLLWLEENLIISDDLEENFFDVRKISEALNYSNGEMANTLISLGEAGFILCHRSDAEDRINSLLVYRITYSGYQFLESIRPESVYQKTLSVCKNVGSFSLDFVSKIAVNILTQLINGLI